MALLARFKQSIVLPLLLFGVVAGSPKAAMAKDASEEVRLITTQGYGEVKARPDSLRVNVGVEARGPTVEKVRTEVNTRLQRVLEELRAQNLQGMSLETQILRVNPLYSNGESREETPKITGYSASNQVAVTLLGAAPAELGDIASTILDSALKGGANVVGGIDFFLKDTSAARGQALAAAVKDATRKARTMATAAKVTLSGLQSMAESSSQEEPVFEYKALAGRAAAPSTPIETGQVTISSAVTARFAF